jgi:hypothetical protein
MPRPPRLRRCPTGRSSPALGPTVKASRGGCVQPPIGREARGEAVVRSRPVLRGCVGAIAITVARLNVRQQQIESRAARRGAVERRPYRSSVNGSTGVPASWSNLRRRAGSSQQLVGMCSAAGALALSAVR